MIRLMDAAEIAQQVTVRDRCRDDINQFITSGASACEIILDNCKFFTVENTCRSLVRENNLPITVRSSHWHLYLIRNT